MSTPLNERMEFAPPPTPGLVRALGLALVAHALLLAFLALGVQWKREAPPVTVEAELWSSIPAQAAAPAPEPVAEEPPEPPEPPQPVVKPKPVVVAPPVPAEPTPDPRIAIAQEKVRLQKEKQVLKEKQEKEKELEKQKLARAEQEKRDKEALKNKKLQEEKEQREKLARDKKAQKAPQDAAKAAAEAKKLADLRQQSIKRMMGLAAGTGEAGSTGTAAQSSGLSAGYKAKIAARIKQNITYTERDSITGNPVAEVEVRTGPAGTIISRRLTQSSGVKSWDEAVLNAFDKTETLPRDTDGKVPSLLILGLRPKD